MDLRQFSRVAPWIAVAAAAAAAGCGFIQNINGPDGLAINKFAVAPAEVAPGAAAKLSWDVAGAESIQIDNGVGTVKAKGSMDVQATRTTTYSITARGGTSTATASVRLVVSGTAATPSPSPSPTPAPSATPTPSPTPSPSPSPSASPTPQPSPSTGSVCGPSVSSAQGCSVSVRRLQALAAGECVEITRLAFSQGCPIPLGASRAVSFEIMTETQLRDLRWRKLAGQADALDPGDGQLIRHGATTSVATQTVNATSLEIEVIASGTPLMVITIKNQ